MTTIANIFNFKRNKPAEPVTELQTRPSENGNFPVLHNNPVVSPEIITAEPTRRDLGRWGWEEASKTLGMTEALENCLQMIRQRLFVQHAADERMADEHKAQIASMINEEEKAINNAEANAKQINEVQIPALLQEKEKLKKRKDELGKQGDLLVHEAGYSRLKHAVLGAVLVLATAAVYIFYVSLVHTAFFRSYLAESMNADISSIEALLNSIFSPDQIFSFRKEVIFPWFIASLFFGIGLLAHSSDNAAKTSKWRRWTPVIAFTAVAFLLDVVLALKLEDNIHAIRTMTGLDAELKLWYENMNFWIVIGFGFMGYLTCAGLFHTLLSEIRKKNPDLLIRKELDRLELQQDELNSNEQQLRADVIQLEAKVKNHRNNIAALKAREKNAVFSPSAMLVDMRHFYEGWLKYLAQDGTEPERMQQAQEAFLRATLGLMQNQSMPV
jgi:predicted nuclease with TOPRIM domain